MITPVALFTYNRVETLKKTVKKLSSNFLANQTDLYIFSDGPKDSTELSQINSVREFIASISGFNSLMIIEREYNYGLTKNILDGINHVLNLNESVIVLEDDILTSVYFLDFMNKAISKYKNNEKVCQVSGYSYLEKYKSLYSLDDGYFIKGGDCMAWGTWKSSFTNYNYDAEYLCDQINKRNLRKKFNRNNSYNYYKMLAARAKDKNNSWAICWYASNFLLNKYTYYPLKPLAKHIGDGDNATNYIPSINDGLKVNLHNNIISLPNIEVSEKKNTAMAYEDFLKGLKGSFFERLQCYIKVFVRENFLI